ncbi:MULTISPECIES: prolyl oligopeptidase family serine peptidase [unclassified Wenzhouxiangella]|uniref:S9 family peptidase n=1 Tax=unclassified Wenzhouxiangella TaxID=2613841 RepID=UPI000E32557A|nr:MULTISPECIES: prolyl oligopeptidase family serine peptidase [unclassified Wenzhouxiangella]RFF26683.1 S9 family peptidase [Wenzhouxiangella sp. 15181]RFP67566.1 S9 family peptidase [Wenzhouxiangella sp. 15190]
MKRLSILAGLLLAGSAFAQTPDLEQIMADPQWIGPPVEEAWWQLDGEAVYYRVEREDSELYDIHRIDLATGEDSVVDYAGQAGIDGTEPVVHPGTGRTVFVREGNLFARMPGHDELLQLTRSTDTDAEPAFSPEGDRVIFRRGSQWWVHDLVDHLNWPVTDLRFEDKPDAEPDDDLAETQLRLFESLRDRREDQQEARSEAEKAAAEDPSRSVAPWYLGEDMEPGTSSLSPDGRWLLLAVRPAGHADGKNGRMPHYVTQSGYIDVEDVRTRVGRNAPAPSKLWLLDLENRKKHELDFESLPGIGTDPLAELKSEQDVDPLGEDELREVSVNGLEWHPDGQLAAVQLRAIDNKDRWTAVVSTTADEPALNNRHRLTDEAWINWYFNDFGWLPDSETLWLLSEETGYSHFYTVDAHSGETEQHTSGDFEVFDPVIRQDGESVLMLTNRSHSSEYDLYRLKLGSDELERITGHKGIESFTVRPGDDEHVLLRYSESYLPPQAALADLESGELEPLTDTRTEQFKAVEWQQPEIVPVPSSHVERPVWAKFYPARGEPAHGGDEYPVVLFVHGAGYLQNTWLRYPNYFREQMFHNLLTERGYHVLDMDYRASAGYGRDWRTAIYRQMGTPELEDLIDGVDWLVENHDADPERVGVYGGSYGGFMAFMAMFKAPEVFEAGAALRPVTDWAHYNHFYTSNILNTPEVDPQAYKRSSPIEFAEGLEGHVLIAHGMLDDNVFYQDSVRLAQRLIELGKNHWEMASYPMEGHGFTRPDSWRDEYWRILHLFERTIGRE